jgi:hypothetical protein
MTNAARSSPPDLLTPQQVAERLLEEATLAGWRSQGQDGLVAVKSGHGTMFRPQDVDAFIHRRYQLA